jgi:hypothetical protein
MGVAASLTNLVVAALRRHLEEKRLGARQYQPPAGPLRITRASQGSGAADASEDHDRYLADKP